MEPKEKAKEIFTKHYMTIFNIDSDYSEECLISILAQKHALISVQEIINGGIQLRYGNYINKNDKLNYYTYWEQVKNEIEKL